MTIIVEAIYENGTLKPVHPLPLEEQQKVQVTVRTEPSRARQTSGLVPWTGDSDTLQRIAEDPEFGVSESR